ncbi:hypothetical protein [Flavobacterium daemonense]|uniref:hypothetical protein n=1 Tax=Flavobacterium daemonense TaxID=1393049 RepID=UPI0011853DEE|nr:hypothetical protein [Flavobacterium daemonense]KAF2337215.1 hypothetical protein FND99_02040 [Flavobacterium daemonense]
MDYYNGKTNDDFIAYYLEVMNCRKELINYTYLYEFTEPDDAIIEHFQRCRSVLARYIETEISTGSYEQGLNVDNNKLNDLAKVKLDEISPLIMPYEEKYYDEVKVIQIDFNPVSNLDDVQDLE